MQTTKRRRVDNAALDSFYLNGQLIYPGIRATVTANTTNELSPGPNLAYTSGSTFNGSAARTLGLSATPSVTSLTSTSIETSAINAPADTDLTLTGATDRDIQIHPSGTGIVSLGSDTNVNGSLRVAEQNIDVGGFLNLTTMQFPVPASNITLTQPSTTTTMVGHNTTNTLTNKTLNSATNTIYPTPSAVRYTTDAAQAFGSGTTSIAFATLAESTGRLATEILVADSNRKWINNSGETRYYSVTAQLYATGSSYVVLIDQYDSLDARKAQIINSVGTTSNDCSVTATSLKMAAGDYIKVNAYCGSGRNLYYSAGPPLVITSLYISE